MLVSENAMMSVTDKEEHRAVNHYRLCDGVGGWENKLFYVNLVFNRSLDKFINEGSHNRRKGKQQLQFRSEKIYILLKKNLRVSRQMINNSTSVCSETYSN